MHEGPVLSSATPPTCASAARPWRMLARPSTTPYFHRGEPVLMQANYHGTHCCVTLTLLRSPCLCSLPKHTSRPCLWMKHVASSLGLMQNGCLFVSLEPESYLISPQVTADLSDSDSVMDHDRHMARGLLCHSASSYLQLQFCVSRNIDRPAAWVTD